MKNISMNSDFFDFSDFSDFILDGRLGEGSGIKRNGRDDLSLDTETETDTRRDAGQMRSA